MFLLRDDKSFPYIFISSEHDFPRIEKHRGLKINQEDIMVHLQVQMQLIEQ